MPRRDAVRRRHRMIDEINKLVANATGEGGCLPTARSAEALARTHPNSGMSLDEISEEILLASIRAGVPVEIGRPRERH